MSDDKRLFIAYAADGRYTLFRASDASLRDEALEYVANIEEQSGVKITHIVPLHGVTAEEITQ